MDKTSEIIVKKLRLLVRTVEISSRHLSPKSHLSALQFLALVEINADESITIGQLAKILGISQPSMSTMIKKLKSLGYIENIQSPSDKRQFFLVSTEKTKKLLSTPSENLDHKIKKSLSNLPPWYQYLIMSVLEKLNEILDINKIMNDQYF